MPGDGTGGRDDGDQDAPTLASRIAAQFSGRGERGDVWRVLDLAVDTDRYLNLGYSGRFRSHLLGPAQRRLVDVVGDRLAEYCALDGGGRLLDLGCGRGGPAVQLADRFDVPVVGLDLVPYNVRRARAAAAEAAVDASFVVGDATHPPLRDVAVAACSAVDALAYVADRSGAIAACFDVLEPGGVLVVTDLVRAEDLAAAEREAVAAFADAWDMPMLATRGEHEASLEAVGFDVRSTTALTPHSVGRFGRYTRLALGVLATPAGRLVRRALRARDVDPAVVIEQVRRAHAALPHLEHVLLVAEKPGPSG